MRPVAGHPATPLAGLLCFVLIITIPFGIAAFRIAGYALWPFGRTIHRRATPPELGSLIGNVLWVSPLRLVAGASDTWSPGVAAPA